MAVACHRACHGPHDFPQLCPCSCQAFSSWNGHSGGAGAQARRPPPWRHLVAQEHTVMVVPAPKRSPGAKARRANADSPLCFVFFTRRSLSRPRQLSSEPMWLMARLELARLVSKQGREPRGARLPVGPGLWRPRCRPPCSQLPLLGLRRLSRLPSQVVRLPGGVGPSLGFGPTSFPPQTSLTTWANMWPSAVALQGLGCRQPRGLMGQGQGPWGPAAAGGSLLSVSLEGSGGVQPAWRRKEAFGRFCVRRGSAV